MFNDFLVIKIFDSYYDIIMLIIWIVIITSYYWFFDKSEDQENIKILKQLNQKIDNILNKIA
jgi:hypothetical protein